MKNKTEHFINDDSAELGKKLRRIRLEQGLTQREVSRKLGISIPGYSSMELGRYRVTITKLKKIAAIFQVNPASLLMDDEPDMFYTRSQLAGLLEKLKTADRRIAELQGKLIECFESKG